MAISNIHHTANDDFIRAQINAAHENRNKKQSNNNLKALENAQKKAIQDVIEDKLGDTNIKDAIEKMNQTIQIFNRHMKLSVHEGTNRIVVKIMNNQSNRIIREIPAKEVLNFIEKLHESIGLLIDQKR